MNLLNLPWLEIAITLTLVGFPGVSRVRNPERTYHLSMAFIGAAFACTVLAWLAFYVGVPDEEIARYSIQTALFGRQIFALDELNAPIVPALALLHLLAALSTSRKVMRRFSFSWSMAAETVRLMTFSCNEPWILIGLLAVSTVQPYVELLIRGRTTRVYLAHMALFLGLLVLGQWAVTLHASSPQPPPWWGAALLALAVLVRSGIVPAHCWVTDWFEHASLGIASLFVIPLSGAYAAVRLVLPIAPAWLLEVIIVMSLFTALYAACMAVVQRETRRFFAHLILSHSSLVLVGLALATDLSLTASLCLWFSVIVSLGGFGLTIRAVEARFGRLSLADYHGLYEHTPALAVCFLLTGLASVGFPGTLGFISTELLVDSVVEASPYAGIIVIAAAALNGIAVMRAYFLLFTGARHVSTISLRISVRERVAVLSLSALILGGGIFPQPGVATRRRAADLILRERRERLHLQAKATPHTFPPLAKGGPGAQREGFFTM
jgi:NADH-quinone oxidoreductase subunit M